MPRKQKEQLVNYYPHKKASPWQWGMGGLLVLPMIALFVAILVLWGKETNDRVVDPTGTYSYTLNQDMLYEVTGTMNPINSITCVMTVTKKDGDYVVVMNTFSYDRDLCDYEYWNWEFQRKVEDYQNNILSTQDPIETEYDFRDYSVTFYPEGALVNQVSHRKEDEGYYLPGAIDDATFDYEYALFYERDSYRLYPESMKIRYILMHVLGMYILLALILTAIFLRRRQVALVSLMAVMLLAVLSFQLEQIKPLHGVYYSKEETDEQIDEEPDEEEEMQGVMFGDGQLVCLVVDEAQNKLYNLVKHKRELSKYQSSLTDMTMPFRLKALGNGTYEIQDSSDRELFLSGILQNYEALDYDTGEMQVLLAPVRNGLEIRILVPEVQEGALEFVTLQNTDRLSEQWLYYLAILGILSFVAVLVIIIRKHQKQGKTPQGAEIFGSYCIREIRYLNPEYEQLFVYCREQMKKALVDIAPDSMTVETQTYFPIVYTLVNVATLNPEVVRAYHIQKGFALQDEKGLLPYQILTGRGHVYLASYMGNELTVLYELVGNRIHMLIEEACHA